MEFRGPILMATALSLVVSAGVLRNIQAGNAPKPNRIETRSEMRGCQQYGFSALFGSTDCGEDAAAPASWQSQRMEGGALFISESDQ